jgi:hypothetical protein
MKFAIGLLLLAIPAASPEIRYFRYQRTLQNLPAQPGQACLAIDAGIFAHAAPQLADLRLYRDGVETPFAIQQSASAEFGQQTHGPLNLGMRGGKVVFDAALSEPKYSDVELSVSAKDFIATVAVSGSRSESDEGATKLGEYTIFDLTGQKLGRSTVLHLPESDFPFLHFSIAGPVPASAIQGLTVSHQLLNQPRYQVVAQTSQVAHTGRATLVEISVPAHVPVDRVAVNPGPQPANFSREVQISVAALDPDRENPTPPYTSSGTLLRVHSMRDGHRIDSENLTVAAPFWPTLSQPTRYTVMIENGDDAPLQIQSIQLQMLQSGLCFEAAASANYTLFYGDPALSAPNYDYATLFAPQKNAAQLTAEPEQPNPKYQPRPDQRPLTERYPALLWIGLVAAIALLGVIALRALKRTTPPE